MIELRNFFCILLLAVSSHAAILTCTFDPAPDYRCITFNLSQVTQPNEEIMVSAPPFTPYADIKSSSLMIEEPQPQVQQFPRNLFGIFTNIFVFLIKNISTTELGTDSFYNCQNLQRMMILSSNLGNIKAGFASSCYFVTTVDFTQSFINSIDENAFVGLISVWDIIMSECSLTCIPPKLFQPLKSLSTIDLSRNHLTAIHSQTFPGLAALSYVNFGNNQITYIPNFNLNGTGVKWAKFNEFSFNNNPIKAIHPLLMTSLFYGENVASFHFYQNNQSAVTCVDPNFVRNHYSPGYSQSLYNIHHQIDNNWMLQSLTYEHFTTCYSSFTAEMGSDSLVTCGTTSSTTTSTTTTNSPGGSTSSGNGNSSSGQCATDKICRYYLDWNNDYTCVIDGADGTVTSIFGTHYLSFTDADLTRLYFTNSYLSKVPKVIFQKFPNLKFLHISNSGLNIINDQTFNECGNLELLDASDNEIFRVEETALRNCTKLRVIDLTGNPIEVIGNGLYLPGPSLKKVHLQRSDDFTLA